MDSEFDQKVDALRKDELMRKIETRYIKYYKHWRDFDMLTTILAVIGLLLAVVEVSALSLVSILTSDS